MIDRVYDENGRDLIRMHLGRCKVVLDLGCAGERIFPSAIGIDIDTSVGPDIIDDIATMDFDDIQTGYAIPFDGVCMSHSLEHIVDTRDILRRIHDALPVGGRIAVTVPDGESVPWETLGDATDTHERLFTPKTLELHLQHAGFVGVDSCYYDRPYAWRQTAGIFGKGVKE
jgi:SAM-dependent methyltransferase